MANFLAPIINEQMVDNNGAPLSGGSVEVYLAGTSTPATTYSDKAGLVPNTWPIVLNTLGVNNQGAVWLTGGAAYKFIIKNSVGVVQRTIDNVSGINDNTVTADQWVVYQGTPTFVSATSFTVVGDQTQTFQIRRRVKTQNTGGIVYSTITNSVFSSPNTTVTVQNDSGVLDSGLSQVSYGIISALDTSLPTGLLIGIRYFTTTGTSTYTPTAGTKSVVVTCVGAGGGGGASSAAGAAQAAAGSGGGGGGYAKKRITSAFSGVTMSIGAGGPAAVGSPGGTGATCSFGGLVSASGGAGGALGGVQSNANSFFYGGAAAGGAGASGDINLVGGFGGFGFIAPTSLQLSGFGGSSFFGVGGPPVSGTGAGIGSANYGSGGSGGSTSPSSGAATGAAGTQGIIIVEEYA